MRGGALPVLAWALLLGVLATICAIWTGEKIELGVLVFAVLATLGGAAALLLAGGRDPLRRGAPSGQGRRPQASPDVSAGTVIIALGLGALVFGLTFGHFLIYFGLGLMVLGAGRLALEVRAQRETLARYRALAPGRDGDPGTDGPR